VRVFDVLEFEVCQLMAGGSVQHILRAEKLCRRQVNGENFGSLIKVEPPHSGLKCVPPRRTFTPRKSAALRKLKVLRAVPTNDGAYTFNRCLTRRLLSSDLI
jgi:hypothetical protein